MAPNSDWGTTVTLQTGNRSEHRESKARLWGFIV